jgi:hypothetical protein
MEAEDAVRDIGVGRVETKKKENAAAAAVYDVNNSNNEYAKFQASAAMYMRSVLF